MSTTDFLCKTTDTTYIVPALVFSVQLDIWDPGAGGSAQPTAGTAGSGGGGAHAQWLGIPVTPGQTITVTIPAGGAGGTSGNGSRPSARTTVVIGATTYTVTNATTSTWAQPGISTGSGGAAGVPNPSPAASSSTSGGAGGSQTVYDYGPGGGSSGGLVSNGNAGANNPSSGGGSGALAPDSSSGAGGAGGTFESSGSAPIAGNSLYDGGGTNAPNPGGGGGAAGYNGNGGAGAPGGVAFTYTPESAISANITPSTLDATISFPVLSVRGTPGGSPLFVSASFPDPEITAVSIYKFPAGVMASKTEILLNGTWTDISDYVYQRDNTVIGRGRPNEATGIQPVSMTMTLNNRDGRFSPKNSSGAYYPFLTRNIQLRLSVNPTSASGQTYSGYRFWGEVAVWPPSWDPTGKDVYCQIQVSGQIRRLQQGAAIGSALYRYYTRLTGNLIPIGYWSCQEGAGSQSFASPIPGVPVGTWTGTPNLAQDESFSGSDPLPQFNGSQFTFPTGTSSIPAISGGEAFQTPGVYTWVVPEGVFSITSIAVVAGGGGTGPVVGSPGTNGGDSYLQVGTTTIYANGGVAGNVGTLGKGGTGSNAPIHHDGGTGSGANYDGTDWIGGGGGGSGGTSSPGNPGGTLGTGAALVPGGGPGGNGGTNSLGSAPVTGYGGGAGGEGNDGEGEAANGAGGAEWAGANSITVIPGQVVTVSVGAAGTGGANGFSGSVTFSWATTPSGSMPSVNANYVRFLLDVPAGGLAAQMDIVVITVGTITALNLLVNTDGTMSVAAFNPSEVEIISTAGVQSGVNGVPSVISIEYVPDGSGNIDWSVNAILPGASQTVRTILSGVVAGQVSVVTEVISNLDGQETGDTGTGHYAIQYYAESLQNVAYAASGYAGELSAARFIRLCTEQSINYKLVGNVNDTPQMGPQVDDTLVNLFQSIESFDLGQVFETRDVFGLGYRTRISLQNQSPVATYDYSLAQISPPLQPTEDDQLTRNDVTISRQVGQDTGSSARAYLASGPMSIQDPPNGVGDYTYANTVAAFADSQLLAIAQWIVIIGTVDDYRYPQITIDLTRSANVNAFIETADIDVGDFFEIVNPPSFLTSETIKQLAWGFTETINNYIWLFTFNAVPEAPYEGTGLPNWQIPLPANANNSGRARPPGLISPMAIEEMKG